MSSPLRFICDNARHLVCVPYSIANLHLMAEQLGLAHAWFHVCHNPHYDIPVRRIEEITAQCTVVSSKEIVRIISGTSSIYPREAP